MRSSSRALLTVPAGGSEPPGFPADPCRDPVTLQSTADYGATGAHLLHVTCGTVRYPRNIDNKPETVIQIKGLYQRVLLGIRSRRSYWNMAMLQC
ncbi:hypothetical protein KOW79_002106 [Hemibagrus wyckioides]|uniref:Uncharacterized protein n=1 Tax=Hemibagrus wyckioides TaxID=337641 RepID=A0A9D3P422_9TELE|nr:hypothetical protein KOW79_002106 [Hemibagrus wyckioides]